MKITVLLGSPHKKGSSNLLAEQFIRGAREAGHTVTVLDAAHMNIHPCLGCEHCGMNGPCAQKDDMGKIRDALLGADLAAFVSPVYYFGLSAQMKMVIDRFYSYTMRLSGKGLQTVLITAAWDSGEDVFHAIEVYYRKLCSYMNFQDRGMVLGGGCGTPAMTARSPHMREALELGRSLQVPRLPCGEPSGLRPEDRPV